MKKITLIASVLIALVSCKKDKEEVIIIKDHLIENTWLRVEKNSNVSTEVLDSSAYNFSSNGLVEISNGLESSLIPYQRSGDYLSMNDIEDIEGEDNKYSIQLINSERLILNNGDSYVFIKK